MHAGREQQLSYDALATRFRGLGSDALQRMLQQLLVTSGQSGSTTLLGSGWFPATLPLTNSITQCLHAKAPLSLGGAVAPMTNPSPSMLSAACACL